MVDHLLFTYDSVSGILLASFNLFNCPLTPEFLSSPPYFSVNRSIGDPANMLTSKKSFDEKHPFEDFQVVTPRPHATWTTSAANVTRYLSEKLLAWGVEERGAYCISISEPRP